MESKKERRPSGKVQGMYGLSAKKKTDISNDRENLRSIYGTNCRGLFGGDGLHVDQPLKMAVDARE